MKYPNFLEQHDSNTTPLSLADFRAHLCEQRFDITPLDVSTGGAGENQFEGALVLPLHR
jgi:hypothetical protein